MEQDTPPTQNPPVQEMSRPQNASATPPPEVHEIPEESVALPKKTIILFPTVILLILISVFAGYLLYQNYLLKKQVSDLTAAPLSTPSFENANTNEDPTADWEIYTSDLYNYSIKYPQAWQIKESSSGNQSTTDATKKSMMTEIFKGDAKISIYYEGDWDHGFEPWTFKNKETSSIDGKTAEKSVFASSENTNEWNLYTIKDLSNFRVEAYFSPADKKTVDQILSTFEFTDEEGPIPASTPSPQPGM